MEGEFSIEVRARPERLRANGRAAMAQKLNFCVIWGAESIAEVRFVKFGVMWEFCSKNWIQCKIIGKKVRFVVDSIRLTCALRVVCAC